jgi:branched-chain amino acid transport system substrate-binding protein
MGKIKLGGRLKVKKTLISILLIIMAVLMIPALAACGGKTTGGEKTLTIGGIAFLTGPASAGGMACKAGWELAVAKYNDAGGLKVGNDTYKIKLIIEDDAMSADQASTAATKLTQQNGAKFIIGPLIDSLKNVVYPIAYQAGALMAVVDGINASGVLSFDGVADVTANKPLYIRCHWAVDEILPQLLDYLQANYPNVKKIAFCGVPEATLEAIYADMANKLPARGLQRVGSLEEIAPDVSDYNPSVARLLSSNPDAICVAVSTPVTWGFVVKAARALGFKGPIFCSTHLDVDFTDTLAGGGSTDIFGVGITLKDMASLPKAVQDVKTLYLAKGYAEKDLISDVFLVGYNGLDVLLQAIQKAKSVDPATVEKVYETLTKKGDLKTLWGDAYVGGLKTLGVNKVLCEPYIIDTCMNGVSKNVKTIFVSVP